MILNIRSVIRVLYYACYGEEGVSDCTQSVYIYHQTPP